MHIPKNTDLNIVNFQKPVLCMLQTTKKRNKMKSRKKKYYKNNINMNYLVLLDSN